ncbi:NAD(P)H oxidoreductase [bacterium]|nr:NAD(P)H oxidoreductase [bacterium]
MPPKTLWYVIHENLAASRGNRTLLETARGLPGVTIVDLYASYPDFNIKVEREQELLRAHDLVVFQHPFYWYSSPALFKQWQDKVLSYGFAYPPKEGTALHGKGWLSVITTGGPDWSYRSGGYNNFTMSELLRPLQQTAYLCGMTWLPPLIVHGVLDGDYGPIKATTDQQLADLAARLREFVLGVDLATAHSLAPVGTQHEFRARGIAG